MAAALAVTVALASNGSHACNCEGELPAANLVLDGESAYSLVDGALTVTDVSTGRVIGRQTLVAQDRPGGVPPMSLAASGAKAFVGLRGTVIVMSPRGGVVRRERLFRDGAIELAGADRSLWAVRRNDGHLLELNGRGQEVARRNVIRGSVSVAANHGSVWVTSKGLGQGPGRPGWITRFDRDSLQRSFQARLPAAPLQLVAVTAGAVVLSEDGRLSMVDEKGQVRRIATVAETSSVIAADDTAVSVLDSRKGRVAVFDYRGERTGAFAVPASEPALATRGGRLWTIRNERPVQISP